MGAGKWRYSYFINLKLCSLSKISSLSMDAGFFEFPSKYFLVSPRMDHLVILYVQANVVALKIGQCD